MQTRMRSLTWLQSENFETQTVRQNLKVLPLKWSHFSCNVYVITGEFFVPDHHERWMLASTTRECDKNEKKGTQTKWGGE